MLSPELRDLIIDRATIKATRKLKRKITPNEVSVLFRTCRGDFEQLEKKYKQDIDKIINAFLELLCES